MTTSNHQCFERREHFADTSGHRELETIDAVNRAEIVEYCSNTNSQGRGVVRLRKFAIKFGRIGCEEVANQALAYQQLDPSIVIVPKIHCYFTEAGRDYLVMEYIEGYTKQLDQMEDLMPALVRAVMHMHTFECDTPGPANRGSCTGTLWPEDEQIILQSREDLSQCVKARLLNKHDRFCLDGTPFVFIHGDLNLRNILFLDNRICLLDWEFAGYFPRSAEIAILYQSYAENMDDLRFRDQLAAAILARNPLTKMESNQVDCWLEFAFNSIRFSW